MPRRTIPPLLLLPLLVVAVVVSSSACGTIANFHGGREFRIIAPPPEPSTARPPVPFGGVLWDVETIAQADIDIGSAVVITPLWLVELGLSATLDTATMPLVFWINARQAWERALQSTGDPNAKHAGQERSADAILGPPPRVVSAGE